MIKYKATEYQLFAKIEKIEKAVGIIDYSLKCLKK